MDHGKPITLITGDPPAASTGVPLWASASIVLATACTVVVVWFGVRRWFENRRNPAGDAIDRFAAAMGLREHLKHTLRGLARDEMHALALLVSPAALADAIEHRLDLPATKRDARSLAELLTVMNGA